ncbi:hypothetical protein RB195_007114 [Necator americanus]|uniref:Uncharacterized protein n=1 Tax=Necator americanus TaxID=51031 RepID=A0ABR1BVP2_NECAM
MEKNICYRQRRRKEVVYDDCVLEDSLSQGDWHIEEDPKWTTRCCSEDYEPVLNVLEVAHDKLGSNFEDHQGIVRKKKGFEA